MLERFGHQWASARRCCWHYCVQIGHFHPCIFLFFHFHTADMLARWAASLKGPCAGTGWRVQGESVPSVPSQWAFGPAHSAPCNTLQLHSACEEKMHKWCWTCMLRHSPLPWRSLLQSSLLVDSWAVWCAVPGVHIPMTAPAVLAFRFASWEALVKPMPPLWFASMRWERVNRLFLAS